MDGAFHSHGPSLLAQESSHWIPFLLLPMFPFRHISCSLSWSCFARPSLLLFPRCYLSPPFIRSPVSGAPTQYGPPHTLSSASGPPVFPLRPPHTRPARSSQICHRSLELRLTLCPSALRGIGSRLPWLRAFCRRRDCPLQAQRRLGPSSLCLQDPESYSTCSCSSRGQGFPPGATPTCLHPLP